MTDPFVVKQLQGTINHAFDILNKITISTENAEVYKLALEARLALGGLRGTPEPMTLSDRFPAVTVSGEDILRVAEQNEIPMTPQRAIVIAGYAAYRWEVERYHEQILAWIEEYLEE